jgi:hypothetical protein
VPPPRPISATKLPAQGSCTNQPHRVDLDQTASVSDRTRYLVATNRLDLNREAKVDPTTSALGFHPRPKISRRTNRDRPRSGVCIQPVDVGPYTNEHLAELAARVVAAPTLARLGWLYGTQLGALVALVREDEAWARPLAQGVLCLKARFASRSNERWRCH